LYRRLRGNKLDRFLATEGHGAHHGAASGDRFVSTAASLFYFRHGPYLTNIDMVDSILERYDAFDWFFGMNSLDESHCVAFETVAPV
jgi:hypothetical protein